MTTALVWFRRDLRLADNPALAHALAEHEQVIPVYVLTPAESADWAPGAASRVWLHHSLTALARSLAEKGSCLLIRRGEPVAVLRDLLRQSNAEAVYWNRLYEPSEIARAGKVKTALEELGISVRSFNSSLLHEPWTVETKAGQPYRVFTPYWKQLRQRSLPPCQPEPDVLPSVPELDSDTVEDLGLLPEIDWWQDMMTGWVVGEDAAHDRLDQFIENAMSGYAEGRDRPDRADTSRLSPHLHFGELSPRQVWHATLEQMALAGGEQGGETFLKELAWRDFAYHLLYHFPETRDAPLNERFNDFAWRKDPQALQQWQQGNTGLPIVDAGMRELWQTGWMHNRVRMIVASFLTKNLRQHWLEGARWFWDTLVDADLANNTQGWQWTAGCGADAAPFFRIFNPVSQGQRFDPQGRYVRRWVPELAGLPDKYLHAPWQAPEATLRDAGVTLGVSYPQPMVDLKASRQAALEAWAKIKNSK